MVTDVVWGGLTAVALGAVAIGTGVEARALLNRQPGDTYSEWLRPWARRHPVLFLAACAAMVAAGAWLPWHILG